MDIILEKEIKFITDFTLNQVKSFGSSLTFAKIVEMDIHPALLKYISAEFDYVIYEDRKKLLSKSNFDYSGSVISKYFNLIGEEIKKSQKISEEDLRKLIQQAIAFNANLLMKPKRTLMKLMFNDTNKTDIENIKVLFNYLYFYNYYTEIFSAYALKKNIFNISSSEFEQILNNTDEQLYQSNQKKSVIEDAINCMAQFFNIGNPGRNKIPVAAVESFLKEKQLSDYLNNIKETLGEDKQSLNISEIKSIIFSIKTERKPEAEIRSSEEKEIVIVEDEQKSEEKPEENLEELQDKKTDVNPAEFSGEKSEEKPTEKIKEPEKDIIFEEEDIDLPADEDEELYKKDIKTENEKPEIKSDIDEVNFDISEKEHLDTFYEFEEKEQDEKIEKDEPQKNVVNKDDEEEHIDEDEQILEEDEEDSIEEFGKDEDKVEDKIDLKDMDIEIEEVLETPEEKPRKGKPISQGDLFTYLTDKEIEKIISNVFNEDKDDFTNTIERMMELETYEEATEILKSVFITYKINPYSRDAVVLTNAVAKYFFNP